jgi:hypothetical protein
MSDLPVSLEVPLSAFVRLAIEAWRLERWLKRADAPEGVGAVRHALRQLKDVLSEHGVEAVDLTGSPYDPGLSPDVVEAIDDPAAPEGHGIIDEMISPVVLCGRAVVSHGQVITRCRRTPENAADDRSAGE